MLRSARRQQTRAMCSRQAASVPPGKTKQPVEPAAASASLIHDSSLRQWSWVIARCFHLSPAVGGVASSEQT